MTRGILLLITVSGIQKSILILRRRKTSIPGFSAEASLNKATERHGLTLDLITEVERSIL